MSDRSTATATTRRIYGRGYHDGMKAAAKEQSMTTAARIADTERNMTASARKVLDCVPMQEVWSKEQVSAELYRRGVRMDISVVAGCLDALKEAGLVREPDRWKFVRVGARPLAAVASPQAPVVQEVPSPQGSTGGASDEAAPQRDTMAKLADVSARLRELATLIDDVALEVEERIAVVGADGQKLRALQSILKSIGL